MAETPGLSPSDLALLANYDTPTICNVIELFALRPQHKGYMDQRIKARFPQMPPMVGYATTATYRTSPPPPGDPPPKSVPDLIETFEALPGPAVVVFDDIDEPTVAASFGDMMCSAFKAFGGVGLVTSGAGRDLEQVEAIDFPVFTGSVICAHGYCHIPTIGAPADVGGITVHTGDLLHGDCNGVTTIPHEIASEAAQVAEQYVAAEKVVLDYVQNAPEPMLDGYSAAIDECKAMIAALKRQVSRA